MEVVDTSEYAPPVVVPGLDTLNPFVLVPQQPIPPEDTAGVCVSVDDDNDETQMIDAAMDHQNNAAAVDEDLYDEFATPQTRYPRLASMSVLQPDRCALFIRYAILDNIQRCLPGFPEERLAALIEQIAISCARQRRANITVAFWWLATQFECVRRMVLLSEIQHVGRERGELLLCAMNNIMQTVRQSSFETYNTWPTIVRSFYSLAQAIVVEDNVTLMTYWSKVKMYEKVPAEVKEHAAKDFVDSILKRYNNGEEPALGVLPSSPTADDVLPTATGGKKRGGAKNTVFNIEWQ